MRGFHRFLLKMGDYGNYKDTRAERAARRRHQLRDQRRQDRGSHPHRLPQLRPRSRLSTDDGYQAGDRQDGWAAVLPYHPVLPTRRSHAGAGAEDRDGVCGGMPFGVRGRHRRARRPASHPLAHGVQFREHDNRRKISYQDRGLLQADPRRFRQAVPRAWSVCCDAGRQRCR